MTMKELRKNVNEIAKGNVTEEVREKIVSIKKLRGRILIDNILTALFATLALVSFTYTAGHAFGAGMVSDGTKMVFDSKEMGKDLLEVAGGTGALIVNALLTSMTASNAIDNSSKHRKESEEVLTLTRG